MRYLISGYVGYGNLGDELILSRIISAIRDRDPAAEITAFSGNPEETLRSHPIDAVPRMHPVETIRAIRACDVLISGGGSLLQDSTSWRPPVYYAGVMLLARAFRRPYVIYGQGIGPLSRAFSRWIAAAAIRHADSVFLRDGESAELAHAMGVSRPVTVTADPVLCHCPTSGPPLQSRSENVVVAPRDWPGDRVVADVIIPALTTLPSHIHVTCVAMQERDDALCQYISDGLGRRGETLGSDRTMHERITAIQSAGIVIGMRLHALVLAAAADRPFIALSYDPKIDAFARLMQQPVAGSIDSPPDVEKLGLLIQTNTGRTTPTYKAITRQLRSVCDLPAEAAVRLAGQSRARRSSIANQPQSR